MSGFSGVFGGLDLGLGVIPSLEQPLQLFILEQNLVNLWIPAFRNMSEQFTQTIVEQTLMVGVLLDAKNQLETQTLFKKLQAQAYKDYRPDLQVCAVGTNVRSLSAAEANYKVNARAIAIGLQRRDALSANISNADGHESDIMARIERFKTTYCDLNDADGNIAKMCRNTGGPRARANRDINYTNTVETWNTLNINFGDTSVTEDEEDVLALAKNIFNFYSFPRIDQKRLEQEYAKDEFQDMRSIDAMRSVAYNSFGHIVGMRAQGGGVSQPYLTQILFQLGVDVPDEFMGAGWSTNQTGQCVIPGCTPAGTSAKDAALNLLQQGMDVVTVTNIINAQFPGMNCAAYPSGPYVGCPEFYTAMGTPGVPSSWFDVQRCNAGGTSSLGSCPEFSIGPSYYAQMEFLTRKIYENPQFYTNLYTSPANVERMGVALEAIKLMQNRDRFEAALRREMLISLLLELGVRDLEEATASRLLRSTGTLFMDPIQ